MAIYFLHQYPDRYCGIRGSCLLCEGKSIFTCEKTGFHRSHLTIRSAWLPCLSIDRRTRTRLAEGMVCLCIISLLGFIRYETRLSSKGLDPLVEFALFRNRRFSLGILMGLVFYMLSAFYLTFSLYLQAGLHNTPLQAGIAMLPFAVSFFFSSAASALDTRRLKGYVLPAGFVLQVIGFGIVALCARYQLRGIEEGLACAGIGFGIVMPRVIKTVIGDIDERHAGLASGMVMTALQIGSALGIAIVGGFFYISLGAQTSLQAYARAFSNAMVMNVALLILGCALSLCLPGERPITPVR